MTRRTGIDVTHRQPLDIDYHGNGQRPIITAQIRIHFPDDAPPEAIAAALQTALRQAVDQLKNRETT